MLLYSFNFINDFSFLVPPRTKSKEVNLSYTEKKSVILECEVECGNPNNYTYAWSIDGKEIINGRFNQYGLDLKTINENSTTVVCTVYNSINITDYNLSESQTVFNIKITNGNLKLSKT